MNFVFAVALLVVSYVITALVAKKQTGASASTLQDFDVPTTAEGTAQVVMFGDCWSGDWTVLWYGDFGVKAIKSGGKK
jgi:hypothetical protein